MVDANKYKNQTYWTCNVPKAFIKKNDITFLIDKLVEEHFKLINAVYHFKDEEYGEEMSKAVLKSLILGAIENAHSSESVSTKCSNDRRFEYLTRGKTIKASTIRKYYKILSPNLNNLNTGIINYSVNIGMSNLNNQILDSSITKALNSSFHIMKMEDIDLLILLLENINENNLEEYLANLEHGELRRSCVKFLKRENSIEEKLSELKKMKEILLKTKQSSIPVYDTDARWTLNKKKINELSYFIQYLVDFESRLITNIRVSNHMSDHREAENDLNQFYNQFNFYPDGLLADSGYRDHPTLEFLDKNNVEAYIPSKITSKKNNGNKSANPFNIENVEYIREFNCIKCALGNYIPQVRTYYINDTVRRDFHLHECNYCECKDYCPTVGSTYFSITGNKLEYEADMRLKEPEGMEIFKHRGFTVEPTIGTSKKDFGMDKTRFKGIDGVQFESWIKALAYNIKTIHEYQLKKIKEEKIKKHELNLMFLDLLYMVGYRSINNTKQSKLNMYPGKCEILNKNKYFTSDTTKQSVFLV